jgi:hypothetical protein
MSSPFNKVFQENSPLKQGGYEGGGDIAGAQYVPTGQMYADMFAKIGQAVSDIDANKKKKEDIQKVKDGLMSQEEFDMKHNPKSKNNKNGT